MNARLQQLLDFVRRNPLIAASLTIIVLMGAASYFLWQRQHTLTVSHEELRRSGEDMLQSLTGSARIAAETTAVNDALDFIDQNLINEGDLADNLGYFYQIESAARIRFSQVQQLSSQPQPPASQFKAVPFSLRATGTYRQILRLLHELETGPRLLRIRTYALNQNEGGPASTGPDGAALPRDDTVTMDLNVELLARP